MIDVSAFVNTGSSPTLGKDSVLKTLGLDENRVSKVLHSVTNTLLKVKGVGIPKCLQQNMIIVPDKYLTTDILGADLIGTIKSK